MAGYLEGKVAVVIGAGNDMHRGVAVALAEAGASIAVAGQAANLAAEAALNSIANEVWAIGKQSTVVVMADEGAAAFAAALGQARDALGGADLVVHCDSVLSA